MRDKDWITVRFAGYSGRTKSLIRKMEFGDSIGTVLIYDSHGRVSLDISDSDRFEEVCEAP